VGAAVDLAMAARNTSSDEFVARGIIALECI
jgi:hypothetical protein